MFHRSGISILSRSSISNKQYKSSCNRPKAPLGSKRSFFRSGHLKDSVYSFGDNTEAQCGLLDLSEVNAPQTVPDIDINIKVKDISAGWRHTFLLAEDGTLLSWGNNNFGHMALPNRVTGRVIFPSKVTLFGDNLKQVAGGRAHSVGLLGEEGRVVTFGMNDLGQLGIGHFEEQAHPWPQLPSNTNKIEFKQIAIGLDHNALLTRNGQVYCWGLGAYGQLGQSDEDILPTPSLVKSIPPLTRVFCGSDTSGGIDGNGQIWIWGGNHFGQLGVEGADNTYVPILTGPADRKFVDVCAGGFHTIALTDSGEVWACGKIADGALGLGESQERLSKWSLINYFAENNIKIKKIASGFAHNVALSTESKVYVWGNNHKGQLGLGDNTTRFTPVENEYFRDREIKGITCGQEYTLLYGEYHL